MKSDFYDVLGVDRSADPATIKKAYRQLAMKFHPDKNPGDKKAEDQFKKAAEAYEVLSNPQKKAQYDRFGHVGGAGSGFGGGFSDVSDIFDAFGDIFGDFFGGQSSRGRSRGKQTRAGADLRYYLEIDLKDVLNGASKEIEFDHEIDCHTCKGNGAKKGTEPIKCATCGGIGQVVRQQGFFQMSSVCPTCRGEGTQITDPCGSCHGKGREIKHKKIEVDIPAGINSGNQLRLNGEGEGGYLGGPAGHLYVEVRVVEDEMIQRHGQDLVSPLKISYLQALLGADISVEGLEGSEELNIPRGTFNGDILKVEGKGLPSLRSKKRGNHLFQVEVSLPKKLAKKEEALLREIAQLKGEQVSEKKGFFS